MRGGRARGSTDPLPEPWESTVRRGAGAMRGAAAQLRSSSVAPDGMRAG
jgi:hypothetical protein